MKSALEIEKKQALEYVFISICTLFFVVLFVNRLRYGIETSDEAFYNATGYRLHQGNIPFGDMWEASAGDAYVMAPFLLVKWIFTSNMDGIQLYFRICNLFMNLVGTVVCFLFLKEHLETKYSLILAQLTLFYAPFQIYDFYYGTLAALFIEISICLVLLTYYKGKIYCSLVAGFSVALAVLVYPTMLFCAVIIMGVLFLIAPKDRFKVVGMFVAGGVLAAIPILIHLAFTIGLDSVIVNLRLITSSGVTPSLSFGAVFEKILSAVLYLNSPFVQYGLGYTILFIVIYLTAIFKKTRILCKYLLVLYPLVCFYYVIKEGGTLTMRYMLAMVLLGPLSIALANDRIQMFKKFLLEWGLSVVIYFVIAFSSGGAALNACAALGFAVTISIKLIIESIHHDKAEKKLDVLLVLLVISVFCEIFLFYEKNYRDLSYTELTDSVEYGVYKGLKTSPERKEHIQDLEDVMNEVEDKGETVMILYHCCYAYLMLDMIPKIPSTWGCVNVGNYGFDNQSLIMEYLSHEENIPENILIIDIPQEHDFADQQVEFYEPYYPELNEFIETHYTNVGTYEKGASGVVVKYEVDYNTFK